MPTPAQKITPCLWFDTEAEDAAKFYCSVLKVSRITNISRYGNEGEDITGKEPGTVMVAAFELNGQPFVALNGGPQFKFSEAISFQIHCKTQDEIDHYWSKLSEGGQEGPCGWLALLAGGADRAHEDAVARRAQEGRTRHQGLHANEEIRQRRARARLCGRAVAADGAAS